MKARDVIEILSKQISECENRRIAAGEIKGFNEYLERSAMESVERKLSLIIGEIKELPSRANKMDILCILVSHRFYYYKLLGDFPLEIASTDDYEVRIMSEMMYVELEKAIIEIKLKGGL